MTATAGALAAFFQTQDPGARVFVVLADGRAVEILNAFYGSIQRRDDGDKMDAFVLSVMASNDDMVNDVLGLDPGTEWEEVKQ